VVAHQLIGESSALFCLCHGKFARWTSNMSLAATSATKSVVLGVMPSAESTPVFSPID
jgi:hypothetical protein